MRLSIREPRGFAWSPQRAPPRAPLRAPVCLLLHALWWSALGLVVVGDARAEGRWCEWGPEGTYSERASLQCREDAACAGTCSTPIDDAELTCIDGTCVPPCSDIRLCEADADCLGGGACVPLSGSRPPMVGGGFSPRGFCRAPAEAADSPFPTGAPCEDTWEAWEAAYLYRTATSLGPATIHALSWSHGDADGDNCANAIDATACTFTTGACPDREIPRPTNCPDIPIPQCCRVTAVGLSCTGIECGCSTLNGCTPEPRPYPNTQCPSLSGDSRPGLCVRLPLRGALGVCFYEQFLEECSALDALGVSCFRTSTGNYTANFFEGDCDGDGCPNGQDSDRCVACDGEACRATSADERSACTMSLTVPGEVDPARCSMDAGLRFDAAIDPSLDAAIDPSLDAAIDPSLDAALDPHVDAGPGRDATTMDAGAPPDFGGSGCRCRAGSAAPLAPLGSGLAAALALLTVTRRRRRRDG